MTKGVLAALGAAVALLLGASPAGAATFTVTSGADTSTGGTLREAIDSAEGNSNGTTVDVIQFDPSVTAVDLESTLPSITQPLTINGPGAATLNVRRSSGASTQFGLFDVEPDSGVTVTIQGLTISGAQASSITAGGIFKSGLGTLNLDSVVVKDNSASGSGGLYYNEGSTSIRNSTFTGNFSDSGGGAITGDQAGVGDAGAAELVNSTLDRNSTNFFGAAVFLGNSATVKILSSTITRNNSNNDGNLSGEGALYNSSDQTVPNEFEVANTLIAGNQIASSDSDNAQCSGNPFTSGGYNLRSAQDTNCSGFGATGDFVNASPLIASVPALNGGSTANVALQAGSPAIDAGNPATLGGAYPACPATDQRALFRGGVAGRCDIGSYELNASSTPPATGGGTTQPPASTPFDLKAAIRKCKKKFPKGPKRKKCIKRAKLRAQG